MFVTHWIFSWWVNHHGNIQVCQRRLGPTNVEHRLTILLEFYMLAVWLVCRKQIPGPLLPNLLVPYQDNGHLTATRRWFNTVHSSNCCVIERAFGRLKGKFRRLKALMQLGYGKKQHSHCKILWWSTKARKTVMMRKAMEVMIRRLMGLKVQQPHNQIGIMLPKQIAMQKRENTEYAL